MTELEWGDCRCAWLDWTHNFCELCANGDSMRTRTIPKAMSVELGLIWNGGKIRISEIIRMREAYGLKNTRMDELLEPLAEALISNHLRDAFAWGQLDHA